MKHDQEKGSPRPEGRGPERQPEFLGQGQAAPQPECTTGVPVDATDGGTLG